MKMTEPYNLGLLSLISAAGEISYEELKQRPRNHFQLSSVYCIHSVVLLLALI